MKYISLSLVLIYLLFTSNANAFSSLVVVVSKDSTIESLNENDVANIFLARTRYYPNGEKSTPVELKDSNPQLVVDPNFYISSQNVLGSINSK